jgi:methyl-accepting chemotaxis protein
MKNLTIKMKLIISFITITLLIGILSYSSISGVSQSSDGFTNYREMARDAVLASRVQANMLMVRMNVKDYLNNPIQKEIDEFNSYFEKTNGFIQTALKEIQKPSRATMVQEMDRELKAYYENFQKVIAYMNQRNEIVHNNLDVNGKKIEQILTSVMLAEEEANHTRASLEAAHSLRVLLLARLYTSKFLLSNSAEASKRVFQEFDLLKEELHHVTSAVKSSKNRKKLSQVRPLIDTYKSGVSQVEQIINERNEIINNKLNIIGPHIAKLAEDIKLSIKKDQDTIGPQVASLNSNLISTATTLSVIILVIIVLIAVVIPNYIASSIARLNSAIVNLIESKDVSSRIEVIAQDEIGTVSTNFNKYLQSIEDGLAQDMIVIEDVKRIVNEAKDGILYDRVEKDTNNASLQELKNIFNEMLDIMSIQICGDVKKVSLALERFKALDFTHRIPNPTGETSQGLNALAEIINQMLVDNKANGLTLQHSAEILKHNVETLSTSSHDAAASLEQTSAALEEMTSNIKMNTDNVVNMASYANELTNSANAGEKLANETTIAMDDIDTQVNAINEAITVIDQIAFQTNILSLNAAVEAATAGEAGKGFAVVAQEVRNLASRSADAAKEIKELVEHATSKANNGKDIANKMIEGYHGLNDNIQNTLGLIKDVENASKEQLIGIEQINDAVAKLDEQTQKNADAASKTQDVAITTNTIAQSVVDDADEKEFIGKESVQAKDIK